MSFLDFVVGQPAWPAAQFPTSILLLDCLLTVLPTQAVVAPLCSCSMHLLELVHGCWRSHVHTDSEPASVVGWSWAFSHVCQMTLGPT